MMVINPLAIIDTQQMQSRFKEFFETVKGAPRWDGGETLLPGEIEYRTELERRRDGIPLPATLYETLIRIKVESELKAELNLISNGTRE